MLPKLRSEMLTLQLCADAGPAAAMKPMVNAPAIAQWALTEPSQT